MKYEISIRINLPEEITKVLQEEKQRFVVQYGSSYKSEPHITLYLESYTREEYPKLLEALHTLPIKPFSITLLPAEIRSEEHRHRNLYVVEITNKESVHALHNTIKEIADKYRSPFIREKLLARIKEKGLEADGTRAHFETLNWQEESFDPHITLGEIAFGKPQADIKEVRKNIASIKGKQIEVTNITVFFYEKKEGAEKYALMEKTTIPLGK